MIADWKPWDTVPERGSFMVWLSSPLGWRQNHSANISENGIIVIANLFIWDLPDGCSPTHWDFMPVGPNGEIDAG